jgi:hypothetical protein
VAAASALLTGAAAIRIPIKTSNTARYLCHLISISCMLLFPSPTQVSNWWRPLAASTQRNWCKRKDLLLYLLVTCEVIR